MDEGFDGRRDDLGAAARRAERLLTAIVLALVVVLAAERAGYAGLYGPVGGGDGSLRALGVQMMFAFPAILYLIGLWQLRIAARAVAHGETFGPVVARALRRVGALLLAGAFATLLAMPLVYRLVANPQRRLIDFDLATLVIAAIGAALIFFARLVDRAAALKHELDEMF